LPSPEFSISVHDLDAAGRQLRLPVRAAWMRGALEATEVDPTLDDGQLDLRLSKSGADVVVRGTLQADLIVPCARCLGPAKVAVREELGVLALAPASTRSARGKHAGDLDDGPDDVDTIGYDGDSLVLDEWIRDELLLGVPMIPLCSEACPGISPQAVDSSARASVDPRMQPLLSFKKT
jgi:uncharacterized protein